MQSTQYDFGPLNRAIAKTAKELNLTPIQVEKVYQAYCKLIKQKLASLPLKEGLTEEEFNQLQTNINLPSLGKIYTDWHLYTNQIKKHEYVQKAKENKAAKHRFVSNDDSI